MIFCCNTPDFSLIIRSFSQVNSNFLLQDWLCPRTASHRRMGPGRLRMMSALHEKARAQHLQVQLILFGR